jgi:hypothetical protein
MTGSNDLSKRLEEAQKAAKELDGLLGTIKFNAADSRDVDRAIKDMERAIDSKASRYRSNQLVKDITDKMKAQFREEILKMARDAKR